MESKDKKFNEIIDKLKKLKNVINNNNNNQIYLCNEEKKNQLLN